MHLSELSEALSEPMVVTQYQPIVRLSDRVPLALEALARLNHPICGAVPPDRFVPLMEEAGLAPRLAEVVAAIAFQDLASPVLAEYQLRVTLNFPPHVLLVPEALDRLDDQCRGAGIRTDQVVIELTEGRPVHDLPALRVAVERLRADGYLVAIDDVGPDVPGSEALLSLPIGAIKLDKGLVMGQAASSGLRAFLERTVEAALLRGLMIIAEGVEDAATWHRLRALGVQCAQGFLIARPMVVVAVPPWLERWRSQADFT
jgi:EAL domain-containing protein (putative c-di-GMP-specific phosphodiesterase class I)